MKTEHSVAQFLKTLLSELPDMALDGGASVEVVEEAAGEPHSDSMDVLHGIGCWFVDMRSYPGIIWYVKP